MDGFPGRAWAVAGIKIGVGLLVLGIALGLRVVSIEPARSGDAAPAEASPRDEPALRSVPATPASGRGRALDRIRAEVDARRGDAGADDVDPQGMVGCRLGGGIQFMTAGDCALRGGRAGDVE